MTTLGFHKRLKGRARSHYDSYKDNRSTKRRDNGMTKPPRKIKKLPFRLRVWEKARSPTALLLVASLHNRTRSGRCGLVERVVIDAKFIVVVSGMQAILNPPLSSLLCGNAFSILAFPAVENTFVWIIACHGRRKTNAQGHRCPGRFP